MTSTLPNPHTPFAYIPPGVAFQLSNVQYIICAVMGAWVADVIMSLPEEYRMLYNSNKRSLSDAVYVFARLTTGALVISVTIYGVVPVGNCHAISLTQGWTAAVQIPVNSLLFFFRIRAVFYQQRYIVAIFGLIWFSIAGTAILAPFALATYPVANTGHCLNHRLEKTGIIGIMIQTIYDTLVFLAISVKLVANHDPNGSTSWLSMVATGRDMGVISKVLLQTGQMYYLVTVGINLASAGMILSPSVSEAYSDVLVPVGAFMNNVMAARVYRRLKLELYYDVQPSTYTSAIEFHVMGPGSLTQLQEPPSSGVLVSRTEVVHVE